MHGKNLARSRSSLNTGWLIAGPRVLTPDFTSVWSGRCRYDSICIVNWTMGAIIPHVSHHSPHPTRNLLQ